MNIVPIKRPNQYPSIVNVAMHVILEIKSKEKTFANIATIVLMAFDRSFEQQHVSKYTIMLIASVMKERPIETLL